jgi:REP-associated tyrosine transposase
VDLNTYKSNRHIVYSNKSHVVWCPKYRRKVLVGAVAKRLERLLKMLCTEMKVDMLALEIRPDHVHLLVEVDPQFGVHRLVKRLKGHTSHALRLEFPALKSRLPTLWTHAYFLSTVGGAPRSAITQYVENQKDV